MSLHDLFANKLHELAGLEKLLIAGLPPLVKASKDAELQAAFTEHLKQTEKQATRITDAVSSLRLESKTDACKPMVAMVADAAKAALTEPEGVIRDLAMLGAAERVEHFEIAAYSSAIHLRRRWATAMPQICSSKICWKSRRPQSTSRRSARRS